MADFFSSVKSNRAALFFISHGLLGAVRKVGMVLDFCLVPAVAVSRRALSLIV